MASKNITTLSKPLDDAAGRTSMLAPSRLDGIKRTIWLTKPNLRELCEDDWDRFEWWLLLNGTREYRALTEAGLAVSHNPLAGSSKQDATAVLCDERHNVKPRHQNNAVSSPQSTLHIWRIHGSG